MAAFGTKVVVLMMVLPSLLLLQTSSVEAVDILVHDNYGCSGTINRACYSTEAGVCCAIDGAAAVQIVDLLYGQSASLYIGGGCTTEIESFIGPSTGECHYNYTYSGAKWYYNP